MPQPEWRDNIYGQERHALFLGKLCVGEIIPWGTNRAIPNAGKWRGWFMSDIEGSETGFFDTSDEARASVEGALEKAFPQDEPPKREITEAHLKRTPIVLSEHTVALITLFHMSHDKLDDLWVHEFVDHIKEIDFAAAQLISQISDGGYCSPAFMIALKREATKWLQAEDDDRASRGVETHFSTAS